MSIEKLKSTKGKSNSYALELSNWIDAEKSTIELISNIGHLWFDKSVELVIFRNQLIDRNVSDIINFHEYAGEFVQKPINIFDSVLNIFLNSLSNVFS